MESYLERAPRSELAQLVRTVWVQRTGGRAYEQRHLPTGGVEIHWPLDGRPRLLGPLTGPRTEIIPAGTTVVGVRFHPGAAPFSAVALNELVDQQPCLADLWRSSLDRLGERIAAAPSRALALLQAHLVQEVRRSVRPDPLVCEAVAGLMPWPATDVRSVAAHVGLSLSQLRRRCLHAVGVGPKVLQRTLRFQGFVALAQAGAVASGRRGPTAWPASRSTSVTPTRRT